MNLANIQDLLKKIDLFSEKEKEWETLKGELSEKQKEAEKKLNDLDKKLREESERRKKIREEIFFYRKVLDYIPHIIFEASAEGQVEFIGKLFYSYTGLEKGDYSTQWKESFHPEESEEVESLWDTSIKSGVSFKFEHRLKNKEGEFMWFSTNVTPVKNATDEIMKWLATSTDIDSEKRAIQRLHDSEEHFRFMAETIPQLVWTAQPNGYEDFHNKRFMEYTGLSVEEAEGWGWKQIIHPEDEEEATKMWKKAMATGEQYETEYRFRKFDGNYRWFLGRALPLKNHKGKVVKWFGTSTDIHDEKLSLMKLQETMSELKRSNTELSRVNDILNNFVYIAAHDLRSPVTNLKMIVDIFKEEKDPDKKEELLGLIEKSSARLDKTINGLVEVIDVENVELSKRDISFNYALESVLADLACVYPEIRKHVKSDFSECKSVGYIEPYIVSVIRNIVSNAYKYRSGKRELMIEVVASKEDGFVKLSIADNGRGFDLEASRDTIFKAFKRLTHDGEGKGVGLFLVKNIVEKNGGRVEVFSKEDVGTTFTIYLKEYS